MQQVCAAIKVLKANKVYALRFESDTVSLCTSFAYPIRSVKDGWDRRDHKTLSAFITHII